MPGRDIRGEEEDLGRRCVEQAGGGHGLDVLAAGRVPAVSGEDPVRAGALAPAREHGDVGGRAVAVLSRNHFEAPEPQWHRTGRTAAATPLMLKLSLAVPCAGVLLRGSGV
jgi:hypothetical protein